jgi:hypothetical protein
MFRPCWVIFRENNIDILWLRLYRAHSHLSTTVISHSLRHAWLKSLRQAKECNWQGSTRKNGPQQARVLPQAGRTSDTSPFLFTSLSANVTLPPCCKGLQRTRAQSVWIQITGVRRTKIPLPLPPLPPRPENRHNAISTEVILMWKSRPSAKTRNT